MQTKALSLLLFWTVIAFGSLSAQSDFQLIENKGQWPDHVEGRVDFEGGKLWFEESGFTYQLLDFSAVSAVHGTNQNPLSLAGTPRFRGHTYRAKFKGASSSEVRFQGIQREYFNFYLGEKKTWRSKVPSWNEAHYKGLYPNIDLRLYSLDRALKYDLIVQPGGDPYQIEIEYEGADNVELVNGRLLITTSVGEVFEEAPIAYQIIDGQKQIIPSQYVLKGRVLSFHFPDAFDVNLPLVIDPVLIFSTYSGSTSDNFGFTATYDNQGYLYAGSSSFGTGYPITTGAFQENWAGGDGQGTLAGTDIAITKYDVSGTFRVYSTFLGGANDDLSHSLIVNDADELIVFGTTSSPNFPVTDGAYSSTFNGGSTFAPSGVGVEYVNGSDIIVSKFTPDGSDLSASTFLGGTDNDGVNLSNVLKFNYADEFRGEVELDLEGNIYIASSTYSNDFPVVGGIQGGNSGAMDACITKFTPDLSTVLFSTYLGGSNDDGAWSLAVTPENDIYVCGGTTSSNFPTTTGAYQEGYGGAGDGFLCLISEDGSTLESNTFFGSVSYDQIYFVECDNEGVPHVYGQTTQPGSDFIINALYGSPNSGMVIARFEPELDNIVWSTQFGSGTQPPNLSPTAFLVDVCGKIYLSGWGGTTNALNGGLVFNMDITNDAYQDDTNGSDFYLMVLEDDASALVYGSYYGGLTSAEHVDGGTSRFNRKGEMYQSVCAGCGGNSDFPIFPANAVSPTNNSPNCNNGVFKFDFQLPITVADFTVPPLGCVNEPIQFSNSSNLGSDFFWDFGDNVTSTLPNPIHTYSEPGTYDVMLVANNSETCNMTDTLFRTILIEEPQSMTIGNLEICEGQSIQLGPVEEEFGTTYTWTPPESLDNQNAPQPTATPLETTEYILLMDTPGCVDTLYQTVEVTEISLNAPDDVVLCGPGDTIELIATSDNPDVEWTWSNNPDFSSPLNDGPNDNDIEFVATEETTYYVQVEDGDCVATEEVTVSFIVGALNLGDDLLVCAGDTATVTLLTPLPGFELNWTSTFPIISGQGTSSIQVIVTDEGAVTLEADDGNGCEVEGSLSIDVSGISLDQINVTATPAVIGDGQTSQLLALPGGYNYSWTPDATLDDPFDQSPLASPEETTTYFVTIADGACVYVDSVQVRVLDTFCGPPNIYVPNAFTPNRDSQNERLFVRAVNITRLYFVIYNRWGEKVFETTSLDEGWDGKYKGRPVDPAVFVYYLEAFCEGGEEYFEKGNITVIR